MPFTFSHPAIVLPLKYFSGKWFSLTGLVIGSLTPDFEYFIRMRIKSEYSHTVAGLFWFNLPVGLALAFLFHQVVRNALFDNLPIVLKCRLISFNQFSWYAYFKRNWFIVATSILIGAGSHLFWDSFTHVDGYFVQLLPILTDKINCFGWQFPLLKILQHGSTILGGMVVIYSLYSLPIDKYSARLYKSHYWSMFTGIAIVVLIIRFIGGSEFYQIGNLVVSLISSIIVSLLLTPVVIRS